MGRNHKYLWKTMSKSFKSVPYRNHVKKIIRCLPEGQNHCIFCQKHTNRVQCPLIIWMWANIYKKIYIVYTAITNNLATYKSFIYSPINRTILCHYYAMQSSFGIMTFDCRCNCWALLLWTPELFLQFEYFEVLEKPL